MRGKKLIKRRPLWLPKKPSKRFVIKKQTPHLSEELFNWYCPIFKRCVDEMDEFRARVMEMERFDGQDYEKVDLDQISIWNSKISQNYFKHKTEEQKQIEEQELKYKSNLEKSEKIFTDSRKILEEFFAKPGNLVTEENFDEKYNAMIQNEVDYNFAIDKFGNKIAEGFQEL